MTQSTPIRIQRTAALDSVLLTPSSSTLAAAAERDLTASPGGRLYGTTPGGSRIVYSREQLMSLASSPLVHQPLPLRNGAQGIPPEIARRGTASELMGSPEKSSMRGVAMLKSANAAAAATSLSTSPLRASRKVSSTKKTTGLSSRSSRISGGARGEDGEADATLTASSDLENDDPVRDGRRSRVVSKGGMGKMTAALQEASPQQRGRDRQPRVSLGSLGVAAQPTTSAMPMDLDDPFGPGGGCGGGGAFADEKAAATALAQLGRRHERGLSSSTASSFASGPPSTRSSISTEAPFVMEL
ncbi:hypothetical protein OC834_007629 [Tilletia horrida]|nr:hypothetical protein OC834_007629 [Tilletia horrida]KAK0524786.1 hypothetical protein OC835_005812 [Tilletia horrida]KAK0559181.1 hypothetical protein OC844_004586 [Tilletia horrida]